MLMAAPTRPWTRADLERLPDDGNRYEVLDGALLVTPLPGSPHQRATVNLTVALQHHCRTHALGFVVAPGPVPHGDSELQPDIAVVLDPTLPFDAAWSSHPPPSLVVEVLSGSTRRRDVGIKRAAYLHWGIAEYWIVEPRARSVTVVRPGREDQEEAESVVWRPGRDAPSLEIQLSEIFR